MVCGLRFVVDGLGFGVSGFGLGFRVSGFGFRENLNKVVDTEGKGVGGVYCVGNILPSCNQRMRV